MSISLTVKGLNSTSELLNVLFACCVHMN